MFGDMDMIPSTMLQSGITESNITVLIGAKNKDLPRFALLGYADQIAFPQTDSMPRAGTLQPEDILYTALLRIPKETKPSSINTQAPLQPHLLSMRVSGLFCPLLPITTNWTRPQFSSIQLAS